MKEQHFSINLPFMWFGGKLSLCTTLWIIILLVFCFDTIDLHHNQQTHSL